MDTISVWHHYNKTKDGGVCKLCSRQIKAAGGSTSGLHSHLKSQHDINLLKRGKSIPLSGISGKRNNQPYKEISTITSYFKPTVDDSFPAVISRLIALDGLPFHKFCTSEDLRKLLTVKGYRDIPKSPNTIRKIVLEYSNKMLQEVINELKLLKENKLRGEVFSLTFDEWTSVKNHRFMNINVHTKDAFWNLGLARVHGSMPAEKCVEILNKKLSEFQLGFTNIVSITTDGASVMKKVGKLIDPHHQLCIAHGIQLAVIKVLYNKTDLHVADKLCDENIDEDNELDKSNESDSDNEENEISNDNLEIEYEASGTIDQGLPVPIFLSNIELNGLITKIRKVVKIFRKSPTKNDKILQKHVKEEFNKEYSLILDCKTRWNSLLAMLERFEMLRNCIRKSLIDIKSEINFTEDELELLSSTILALQPVKAAVEQLCCEDANLFIADITLKFMIDELTSQNTVLSIELKEALLDRIKERRTVYSDVLQYLHNPFPEESSGEDYGVFNKTSESTIRNAIVEVIGRISKQNLEETSENTNSIDLDDSSDEVEDNIPLSRVLGPSTSKSDNAALSIKEKLQLAIRKKINVNSTLPIRRQQVMPNSVHQCVKTEMQYFRKEGIQGKYLKMAFAALMTTRPTSVESERAFSVAGTICTKIRSRLSDNSIDKLCFLRAFFIKQKKSKESLEK